MRTKKNIFYIVFYNQSILLILYLIALVLFLVEEAPVLRFLNRKYGMNIV